MCGSELQTHEQEFSGFRLPPPQSPHNHFEQLPLPRHFSKGVLRYAGFIYTNVNFCFSLQTFSTSLTDEKSLITARLKLTKVAAATLTMIFMILKNRSFS